MSYRLIVGLGNPGKEYEATRHNVGFLVVDQFAAKQRAEEWKANRNFKGDLSQIIDPNGEKIHLLKPTTYMNDSGSCIQKVCSYYKIPPEEMIIVYDEINLPVAEVKISLRGSAGGHNGMDDILKRIHSSFTRLRIGVGQKPHKEMDLADFVLGKFSPEDQNLINASMDHYLDCLQRLIRDGSEKAMMHINRKPKNNDRDQSQL